MFEKLMEVGRHATIAGVLRSALYGYGLHFTQQGLMDIPAGAFALAPRRRR